MLLLRTYPEVPELYYGLPDVRSCVLLTFVLAPRFADLYDPLAVTYTHEADVTPSRRDTHPYCEDGVGRTAIVALLFPERIEGSMCGGPGSAEPSIGRHTEWPCAITDAEVQSLILDLHIFLVTAYEAVRAVLALPEAQFEEVRPMWIAYSASCEVAFHVAMEAGRLSWLHRGVQAKKGVHQGHAGMAHHHIQRDTSGSIDHQLRVCCDRSDHLERACKGRISFPLLGSFN